MPNLTWIYVAAIYAAAVWLARRAGIDLPWRIAAFFYALVLLFLFRPMTGDVVNLPVDFLQTLPPWIYVEPTRPVNSDLNDLTLQIVPWAHQVRESWKSLDVPLWNHLSGSGYPLMGNGQSGGLSLLRLLALPLPLGQSFTAEAAMKFLIALTFTFLFCRRRGYSELASGIGALCFGFCTFLNVWLHFPLVTVAVLLPASLHQIDLMVDRVTYGRSVFFAALIAVMFFGGHPETVAHIAFISGLYLLWILIVERPLRSLAEVKRLLLALGGVAVVALLLAAPFLAVFAEAVTKSKRYYELQFAPNIIAPFSDLPSAVLLLQPHFYGQLPGEKAWGPATPESITGFAGILGVAGWFALLVYVAVHRQWRSREAFFVLAGVLILGIILSWPGLNELFHFVFRLAANARLRFLLCFVAAVIAAAVADLLLRGEVRPVLGGLAFGSALVLLVMREVRFPSDVARDTALFSVLPSLLVIFIAAAAALAGKRRDLVVMLLAVAIVAELWTADRGWNPELPDRLMYPETPLIQALQDARDLQPPDEPFRVVGINAALFPNSLAYFGFEDIRTHDPMAGARYLGLLRGLTLYELSGYFALWKDLDTKMLDLLNVRYVITMRDVEPPDKERFIPIYRGRDGAIFENRQVLPRFFAVRNVLLEFRREEYVKLLLKEQAWDQSVILNRLPVDSDRMRTDLLAPRPEDSPNAEAEIVSASPTEYELRVKAPRHSFIVSSIALWPGWHVRVGGRKVEPLLANGAFLGFTVPPGEHDVRVYYAPLSFRVGAALSVMTMILLGAKFIRSATRDAQTGRRKISEGSTEAPQ